MLSMMISLTEAENEDEHAINHKLSETRNIFIYNPTLPSSASSISD